MVLSDEEPEDICELVLYLILCGGYLNKLDGSPMASYHITWCYFQDCIRAFAHFRLWCSLKGSLGNQNVLKKGSLRDTMSCLKNHFWKIHL